MEQFKNNLKQTYTNEQSLNMIKQLNQDKLNKHSCQLLTSKLTQIINTGQPYNQQLHSYEKYYARCDEFDKLVLQHKENANFIIKDAFVNALTTSYDPTQDKITFTLYRYDF